MRLLAATASAPLYAPSLFTTLASLVLDEPRTVLDLGSGPGDLTRYLVGKADRVDAVDMSRAMIERGRSLERGDHPNLRWIHGTAEDAALDPPYALVVAGDSLHWMDREMRAMLERHLRESTGKRLQLTVTSGAVWGMPHAP